MSTTTATTSNSTYTNPILPGWHSDPSCVFVPEENNTFFCTTSSFLSTPAIPIYASQDLTTWKLASHVVTRRSQVPEISNATSQTQQDGLWASTIRYRKGKFYLLTSYVSMYPDFKFTGLLFTSSDIFDDAAWSEPLRFQIGDIDPDIFWDDDVDGQAYITYAGISQVPIDLETGETGTPYKLWAGTGAGLPEGPHIYKKDGWYYLCIGEGGTELGHRQVIARSRKVSGPYEGYEANPVLTNAGTGEYFQTVGHADLFQDKEGHWWGVALATRSGPNWRVYPMGRETVLFPVTWEDGEWPVLGAVRGTMTGPLPVPECETPPGDGPYVDADDDIDFEPGSGIPRTFLFWRFPNEESFAVSPAERPYSLRLLPLKSNITGSGAAEGSDADPAITLVTRIQSHTYFTYSVDISFAPTKEGEEAGITLFLTQYQHIDLGIVLLPSSSSAPSSHEPKALKPHLRFQTTLLDDLNTPATQNVTVPDTVAKALPSSRGSEIKARLKIQAIDDTHYTLSATLLDSSPGSKFEFTHEVEAVLVSGGTGRFTGALLGTYATSNGGDGGTPAYISRWRYNGLGQKIERIDTRGEDA
ncbi:glycosyl hydrolase [Aspergillus pseudoustus]|uniref:Glycosyl hydrolase n=1 Tax=Aspergillus pseudoustus TaxID=1810923 RepID=A0ABR4J6M7_9EURO